MLHKLLSKGLLILISLLNLLSVDVNIAIYSIALTCGINYALITINAGFHCTLWYICLCVCVCITIGLLQLVAC